MFDFFGMLPFFSESAGDAFHSSPVPSETTSTLAGLFWYIIDFCIQVMNFEINVLGLRYTLWEVFILTILLSLAAGLIYDLLHPFNNNLN